MAEKLEDLNLPNAVVARIIKDSIPDNQNAIISKEARIALGKAASVFVLYVTSAATNVAKKSGRKTLTGQDIIDAMSDLEFDSFIEPLREAYEVFKQTQKDKKEASKKKQQKPDEDGGGGGDVSMNDDQANE